MAAGALVNTYLRLFRLLVAARWNYFVDCSGDCGAWMFWNSACIQIPLRYSCGLRHARPGHFLLDAGTCRIASFSTGFLGFLMHHAPILTSRWKPFSPISHTYGVFGRFVGISLIGVSASALPRNRRSSPCSWHCFGREASAMGRNTRFSYSPHQYEWLSRPSRDIGFHRRRPTPSRTPSPRGGMRPHQAVLGHSPGQPSPAPERRFQNYDESWDGTRGLQGN